ncbi:hypothetical protein QJS10_CPB15g01170 [Acorus calamus]|uniref:Uncharacterized protein n=1 Tax=Acorus calamus TaxID=4465 RepID=A0AAV9D760_ACOCL|nr:hypothetical protein QJS10_CPB15g01170 [Acorus calamus]
MGSSEFAEMMFLDGCFILGVLLREKPDVEKMLLGKLHDEAMVRGELLKLQSSLKRAMDANFEGNDELKMLRAMMEAKQANWVWSAPREKKNRRGAKSKTCCTRWSWWTMIFSKSRTRFHSSSWRCSSICSSHWKEAGVVFKPKRQGSFIDVTFKNGVMEIPVLCIYENTFPIFRNLIAFEQCYPNTMDHITYYASFMESMIKTPGDVKALQSEGTEDREEQ